MDPTSARRHSSIADLVTLVVVAALGMALFAPRPGVRPGLMLLIIPPLVGIWWDRRGGGRGISGGAWGGMAIWPCVMLVSWITVGFHWGNALPKLPLLIGMMALGMSFGIGLGSVAWIVVALLNRLGRKSERPNPE